MLFRSYGLPLREVREVVRLCPVTVVPNMPAHVRGVINLRGAILPVFDLRARFGIDNAHRTLHGALLDAELLSEVYVELVGGRQASMLLASDEPGNVASVLRIDRPLRPKREFAPTADELAAHANLVASLKNPIWSAA